MPVGVGQHRRQGADDVEDEQVEDGRLPRVRRRRAREMQQAERLRARQRQKGQRREHGDDHAGQAREHDARVHGHDRVGAEIGGRREAARRVEAGGDEADVHAHTDPGLQPPAPVRARGEVVRHVHEEPEHGGDADDGLRGRHDREQLVEDQHQEGHAGADGQLLAERPPAPRGLVGPRHRLRPDGGRGLLGRWIRRFCRRRHVAHAPPDSRWPELPVQERLQTCTRDNCASLLGSGRDRSRPMASV